ncbi:MAG: hypothetical protein ABI743_01055 [bacterium]
MSDEDPKKSTEEIAAAAAAQRDYGEMEVDADVGNVPPGLIWVFVFVVLWGIFAWIPFFGGAPGSYW